MLPSVPAVMLKRTFPDSYWKKEVARGSNRFGDLKISTFRPESPPNSKHPHPSHLPQFFRMGGQLQAVRSKMCSLSVGSPFWLWSIYVVKKQILWQPFRGCEVTWHCSISSRTDAYITYASYEQLLRDQELNLANSTNNPLPCILQLHSSIKISQANNQHLPELKSQFRLWILVYFVSDQSLIRKRENHAFNDSHLLLSNKKSLKSKCFYFVPLKVSHTVSCIK